MGMLLILIGLFWAAYGVFGMFYIVGKPVPESAKAFNIVLDLLVFIFPGLVLTGFGSLIRRKRKA